ncbi:MAG: transposase [Steroidobacteraceae bacterium]|nr:transposase [Steroidobacteraceae bacterium]
MVHFYRNVFSHVPNGKVTEVARMLKAIHTQEDRKAAAAKAKEVVARLKAMKLKTAAELVEQKIGETLTYYAYPSTHWRQLRTKNPLERIIREIRRRTPSGGSISGWLLGVDAGRGETETHRFDQMGQAPLLCVGDTAESREAGGGLMKSLLPGLRPGQTDLRLRR